MSDKKKSNQVVFKNMMIGLVTIVIGALLSVSLLPSKAHATSCDKEYISLELAYLSSDVIFSGYAERKQDNSGIEYKVTEVFKAKDKNQKIYYTPQNSFLMSSINKVNPKIEYIFYGQYTSEDNIENITVSICSKTRMKVSSFEKLLKDGVLSEDKIGKKVKLIIKGKAVRKTVDTYARAFPENTPEEYKKRPHKPIVKAIVDFEVLDIYQNKTESFQPKLDKQQISVSVNYCEKGYEIGGEYLILIKEVSELFQKRREHQGKAALPRFSTSCLPFRGTWSFDEEEHLRKLKLYDTGR